MKLENATFPGSNPRSNPELNQNDTVLVSFFCPFCFHETWSFQPNKSKCLRFLLPLLFDSPLRFTNRPTEHKLQKSLAHQFITKCRVLLKKKTMPFFLPNIFHFLRSWSSCHRQSQIFPLSFPSSIKLQPLASSIEL